MIVLLVLSKTATILFPSSQSLQCQQKPMDQSTIQPDFYEYSFSLVSVSHHGGNPLHLSYDSLRTSALHRLYTSPMWNIDSMIPLPHYSCFSPSLIIVIFAPLQLGTLRQISLFHTTILYCLSFRWFAANSHTSTDSRPFPASSPISSFARLSHKPPSLLLFLQKTRFLYIQTSFPPYFLVQTFF